MRESEHFPAERDIVVTLKLLLDSVMVFIGQLTQISRDGLSFDYLVLRENLEGRADAGCEVSAKKNSDVTASLESVSCWIVHDELAPVRSPFGLPVRRCHIRFSKPLPLAMIQPLIKPR